MKKPRVLTGSTLDAFNTLCLCYLRRANDGTIGTAEGQVEIAHLGRRLAGAYLSKRFFDNSKGAR